MPTAKELVESQVFQKAFKSLADYVDIYKDGNRVIKSTQEGLIQDIHDCTYSDREYLLAMRLLDAEYSNNIQITPEAFVSLFEAIELSKEIQHFHSSGIILDGVLGELQKDNFFNVYVLPKSDFYTDPDDVQEYTDSIIDAMDVVGTDLSFVTLQEPIKYDKNFAQLQAFRLPYSFHEEKGISFDKGSLEKLENIVLYD